MRADLFDQLNALPVFDHHCHNWRIMDKPFDTDGYRMMFTEAVDSRAATGIPDTIYYRWTIRELAARFDCEPSEAAVLDARATLGHDAVAGLLMAEANVSEAILDFGYAGRGANNYDVAAMSPRLGGATTWGALRLETVLQDLIARHDTAEAVEEEFRRRLDAKALRAERIVSLKSIVAYRTGLDLVPTPRAEAYSSFTALKTEANTHGSVRVNDKCFLDYFLGIALAWANEEAFPIQFHTGFGDPSVFLRTGNPIMLRSAFENPAYANVPFVLLHAGWPYVRESSYLASVYPNVFIDAGLAIPFAATEYPVIWQQLLSVAPASKVLWSSDGFILPEHCWFAAVQGRKALGVALAALVELNAISEDEFLPIASAILRDNASRLYRVRGDAV
jgi:predicted TIM-barrel fold metal-dependent hydrolase